MKTHNYIVNTNGTIISKVTGKPMSFHEDKKGYLRVRLSHEGSKVTSLVHRVIASVHIPNPDNLPQINHIDGDKSNNDISNLEWVTGKANVEHSVSTGLVKRGSDRPNSKFQDSDIYKVRSLYGTGEFTYYQLADMYGCSYQTIHRICKRQTYTHLI